MFERQTAINWDDVDAYTYYENFANQEFTLIWDKYNMWLCLMDDDADLNTIDITKFFTDESIIFINDSIEDKPRYFDTEDDMCVCIFDNIDRILYKIFI